MNIYRLDESTKQTIRDLFERRQIHYDSPNDLADDIKATVDELVSEILDDAPVCRHRVPWCECPDWYKVA